VLHAVLYERCDVFLHCYRSTYATTVRDTKYAREREFLKAVSQHLIFLAKGFLFSVSLYFFLLSFLCVYFRGIGVGRGRLSAFVIPSNGE